MDGHMAVTVGNVLGTRYCVQDSLGKGTFGSVVRVKDIQTNHMRAMKISLKKSSDTHCDVRMPKLQRKNQSMDGYEMALEEVETLKLINQLDAQNKELVIRLFDSFTAQDRVFAVTELLSQSVYEFQRANSYRPFPASQVQHIAYQICHALRFLHDKNILHTDIKPENIVFVHGESDVVPPPEWKGDIGSHPKPIYRVLRRTEVRLIDFGSAVHVIKSKVNDFKISTREYRCIESVLELPWGPGADIWSFGCTIVDMFCGFTLFEGVKNISSQLVLMETYLGPLPKNLLDIAPPTFKNQRTNSKKDTSDPVPSGEKRLSVISRFRRWPEKCKPEKLIRYFDIENDLDHSAVRIYALVTRMLEYLPEERITAQGALRHSAFLTLEHHLKDI